MALLRQLSCDGGPDKSGRARNKKIFIAPPSDNQMMDFCVCAANC